MKLRFSIHPRQVARVELRNPDTGTAVSDVLLLLDTGADVTLLPHTSVRTLGVSPLADLRYELMGFDGSKSFASVVLIDMVFLNRVFRSQYLLTEDDCGILGRDILNHLILLLDGPRRQWSEHTP